MSPVRANETCRLLLGLPGERGMLCFLMIMNMGECSYGAAGSHRASEVKMRTDQTYRKVEIRDGETGF